MKGKEHPVTDCAISSNGKIISSTYLFDHTIKVWDSITKNKLLTLDTQSASCGSLSSDRELIAYIGTEGTVNVHTRKNKICYP
jgi:WD40 repeat protein